MVSGLPVHSRVFFRGRADIWLCFSSRSEWICLHSDYWQGVTKAPPQAFQGALSMEKEVGANPHGRGVQMGVGSLGVIVR